MLIKVNEASCKYVVKHKSVSVIARVGGEVWSMTDIFYALSSDTTYTFI